MQGVRGSCHEHQWCSVLIPFVDVDPLCIAVLRVTRVGVAARAWLPAEEAAYDVPRLRHRVGLALFR